MSEATFNTIAGVCFLFLPALVILVYRLTKEVRRLAADTENLRSEILKLKGKK